MTIEAVGERLVLDPVVLGQPSYLWRFGQERRLEMIQRFVRLDEASVLDLGCGVGGYVRRFADFTPLACGVDIDREKLMKGVYSGVRGLCLGVSESLPFADGVFEGVLLNEVIEHVRDDCQTIREALRVTRPGGKVIIFAPNRLYPFETHGVYLGKRYVFGNIPMVNYLPGFARNRLVPHARAYTKGRLRALTKDLPGRWIHWSVVYPGFDNVMSRRPALGRALRKVTYGLERTWLRRLGLSHLLVLERTA